MSNTFSEASFTLRPAKLSDAAQMIGIYRPFIEEGAITFEIAVPSVTEFEKRIETIQKEAPWLVAVIGDKVVGYAYASQHRTRAAYQWAVEASVYVDASFYRRGIAKALYSELLRLLQAQGYVTVLAGITLPNDRSVHFHEALGFRHFATYVKIGFKQGKWHDVGWWEKIINPFSVPPPSIVKPVSF